MNFETVAYYLFSSLLQADAAIIGFGLVFVIYRLQSIENRYELAIHILDSARENRNHIDDLKKQIIENEDPVSKGSALRQHLNLPFYKEMELLVTIPLRANVIKQDALGTLRFICIHMFVSACSLFFVPLLKDLPSKAPVIALCAFILFYFGAVIVKVEHSARNAILREREFDLQSLSTEIYKLAHS